MEGLQFIEQKGGVDKVGGVVEKSQAIRIPMIRAIISKVQPHFFTPVKIIRDGPSAIISVELV